MRWRCRLALAASLTGALSAAVAVPTSAETFRRPTGAQIRARFAGMDMSDGVHWRDSFSRDGTLKSVSMGKQQSGTWRVEENQLCTDLGKDSGGCYEAWIAGANVEFRREGLGGSILEGKLTKTRPGGQTPKGNHP